MSMTSAFALGFDHEWCRTIVTKPKPCHNDNCCDPSHASGADDYCCPSRASPYFDASRGTRPATLGVRPAMMLAWPAPTIGSGDGASGGWGSVEASQRLIDRGVAADGTRPDGGAAVLVGRYLGGGKRIDDYQRAVTAFGGGHPLSRLSYRPTVNKTVPYATGEKNMILYQTESDGDVPLLQSNSFAPGAVADSGPESFGGQVWSASCAHPRPAGHGEMPLSCFVDAGATASYGTVEEPCDVIGKFPNSSALLAHYLDGDTLVEAYWKSVAMPGEGLFVGEPLARPWAAAPAPP